MCYNTSKQTEICIRLSLSRGWAHLHGVPCWKSHGKHDEFCIGFEWHRAMSHSNDLHIPSKRKELC
jgi:hypothetical protein